MGSRDVDCEKSGRRAATMIMAAIIAAATTTADTITQTTELVSLVRLSGYVGWSGIGRDSVMNLSAVFPPTSAYHAHAACAAAPGR